MRKIVLVLGFAMAACSGSDDKKGEPKPCTPQLGGACSDASLEACDCSVNTRVIYCNGTAWTQEADCSTILPAGSQVCGPGAVAGDFTCVADPNAAVQEFGECQGTGQGNCDTGLTCLPFDATTNICFDGCDQAVPTSCGPNRTCEPTGLTAPNPTGVCFEMTAARDDECGLNFNVCVDPAHECAGTVSDNTGNVTQANCKLTCPPTELGEPGDGTPCPIGENCLPSEGLTVQTVTCPTPGQTTGCNMGYTCQAFADGNFCVDAQSAAQYVPCTDTANCDTVNEYRCMNLNVGRICARDITWCGEWVPLLGGYTQAVINAYFTAGNHCDSASDHQLCGILGAVGDPATTFCYDFSPTGQEGRDTGCIGLCDEFFGDGVDELDCGVGYYCDPDAGGFYNIQQTAGGSDVTCTDNTPCDQPNGFTCTALGTSYCAKPFKHCLDCKGDSDPCTASEQCCAATLGVCDVGVTNTCT